MTAPEALGPDEDFHVRRWLGWLEGRSVGCALCKSILLGNELHRRPDGRI